MGSPSLSVSTNRLRRVAERTRWQELVPLASLVPSPKNPKLHSEGIQTSISRFGFIEPVVIDERTGQLISGHGRMEALQEAQGAGQDPPEGIEVQAGEWLVPVNRGWASKNDQEASAALVALNRYVELGGWDDQALADILQDLSAVPDGLEGIGYDQDDLDQMLAALDEAGHPYGAVQGDPDEIPEPPAIPRTKLGDVWVLERHRVACGDSGDAVTLELLMAGGRADALIMDPPYGVDYGDTVAFRRSLGLPQRPSDDSHVRNDGQLDAAALWAAVFPGLAAVMAHRSAFYCWSPPGDQQSDLGLALRDAGFAIHGSVIWVKSNFSFSRADHKYQHEPCWYGWLADGVHDWHGENNETSVWEFPKPSSSPLHPTQKPVDLIARCVRNITTPRDVILDPFGGSGTTLIAAHQEGRPARLCEISERYVDVICKRFQSLTGIVPVLESTGEPVDFLAD